VRYLDHKKFIVNNLRRSLGLKYSPLHAKVEITRKCNLNCRMCLRQKLKDHDRSMSMDMFKDIIDSNSFTTLYPHGYGEPLCHPRFLDMMSYCHSNNVETGLVTNGTLFSRGIAERYLRLNPYKVTFSIDSPFKKEYEYIRRGADFDVVMKNLRDVVKVRNRLDVDTRVSIHMTVNKFNKKSIPAMEVFCRDLGIGLSVSDITVGHDVGTSKEEFSIRNGNYNGGGIRECKAPWNSVYIDVSGDVFPCTDNLDFCLGNISESSIFNIFNSDRMKRFRMLSRTGRLVSCNRCTLWSRGRPHIWRSYFKMLVRGVVDNVKRKE